MQVAFAYISNDYMDKETTYRYYNEMMWPERFAECVSVEDAKKMLRRNRPGCGEEL